MRRNRKKTVKKKNTSVCAKREEEKKVWKTKEKEKARERTRNGVRGENEETGTTKNRNKYKNENKQMTSPSSNSAAADGDAAGGSEAVSSRWQSYIAGSRRTLRILTFTSVAYFTLWSPYVALVVVQSITGTFEPPSAVEFAAIWPAAAEPAS